jgi:hypothetical protein
MTVQRGAIQSDAAIAKQNVLALRTLVLEALQRLEAAQEPVKHIEFIIFYS